MMRRLFVWPMVVVLLIKLRVLRGFLGIAQEQTEDARALLCSNCPQTAGNCHKTQRCTLLPLINREVLLVDAIAAIECRISVLVAR